MSKTENKPQAKRGRPRITTPDGATARTVAGQLEPAERQALERIAERTGRTLSELVRGSVLILISLDEGARLDWGQAIERIGDNV